MAVVSLYLSIVVKQTLLNKLNVTSAESRRSNITLHIPYFQKIINWFIISCSYTSRTVTGNAVNYMDG